MSTFEGVHVSILGLDFGNLQILFLISTLATALPIVLLRLVWEAQSTTSGYVLEQFFHGNPLGFVYHQFLFSRTTEERRKAEAVRGMGRSRSPMAVETLIAALDDVSPQVRSHAALGLGEMRRDEAIEPLIQELRDHESDIRTEAAEALGKIGHPRGVNALLDALHDTATRVRISAIRGLTEIGGEEIQERLFWMFCDEADRMTFLALVEALSRLNDTRIVKPTLERVLSYRSPVIRLQLMNGVCRTIGGEDQFYKLLSMDEFSQAEEIGYLLRRAQKTILMADVLPLPVRQESAQGMADALSRFEHGDAPGMGEAVSRTANVLRGALKAGLIGQTLDPETASRAIACLVALTAFLNITSPESLIQGYEAFLTVCLVQLTTAMMEVR